MIENHIHDLVFISSANEQEMHSRIDQGFIPLVVNEGKIILNGSIVTYYVHTSEIHTFSKFYVNNGHKKSCLMKAYNACLRCSYLNKQLFITHQL